MNFHQETQPDLIFNLDGPQDFRPEYLSEAVTPYFINKSTIFGFSKMGWLRKILSLPRVSSFMLEALEKSNDFTLDLHNSLKQIESRIERLDGLQGDFRVLQDKLLKIETNANELQNLRLTILSLKKKNQMMWAISFLSLAMNLAIACFLFTER